MHSTLSMTMVSALIAGSACGATLTVDQLLVTAPNSITASSSGGRIMLDGDIGPVTGSGSVDLALQLDFSFVENTINGDSFLSFISLMPTHDSGVLQIMSLDLEASLYDGADLVTTVENDHPGLAHAPLASGQAAAFSAHTASFKRSGYGAFTTIGDHGEGTLELALRWTGFAPGDDLVIDLSFGPIDAGVLYLNFIPSPGGVALLGLGGLAFSRRRRC